MAGYLSNRITLSFKEISEALAEFALPSVDLVIGIGRGGIVPASLAAYKLGCELQIAEVNYRNDQNDPIRPTPEFLAEFAIKDNSVKHILLVDDVSVSGSTIDKVKSHLSGFEITTFVLKGKADLVLFPQISSCVNWPWNQILFHEQ